MKLVLSVIVFLCCAYCAIAQPDTCVVYTTGYETFLAPAGGTRKFGIRIEKTVPLGTVAFSMLTRPQTDSSDDNGRIRLNLLRNSVVYAWSADGVLGLARSAPGTPLTVPDQDSVPLYLITSATSVPTSYLVAVPHTVVGYGALYGRVDTLLFAGAGVASFGITGSRGTLTINGGGSVSYGDSIRVADSIARHADGLAVTAVQTESDPVAVHGVSSVGVGHVSLIDQYGINVILRELKINQPLAVADTNGGVINIDCNALTAAQVSALIRDSLTAELNRAWCRATLADSAAITALLDKFYARSGGGGVVVHDSVVAIIDSANGTVGQMQLLEVHEPSFRTNGLSFGYRKYWVKLGALSTGSAFLKIWTDSANGVYMTKASFDGANVRLDNDIYIDPVYNDIYFHSTRWQVNAAWNGTVPVSNNTALVATGSTTKHFRLGYSYAWKQQLVGVLTIRYAMTGTATTTPFVFFASRFAN